MTPTLVGRIQTRIFLVVVVGIPWTLIVGAPLAAAAGVSTGDMYAIGFSGLVLLVVVGIGWDSLYHAVQQLRWEKDWPTLFGLITVVNEGLVVLLLLLAGFGSIPIGAFLVLFVTTWLLIWLAANGPIRVTFLRWRYRGGRLG